MMPLASPCCPEESNRLRPSLLCVNLFAFDQELVYKAGAGHGQLILGALIGSRNCSALGIILNCFDLRCPGNRS
ncbi:hypothetical protein M413DRAFT_393340 [Hebeloma cylindrosporum]|uniref:Uncharacterized protein n=1 Tax=Hebeloma cylindrosporum TaxID=76867 RepID=A0A0C2XZF1_HEBCY|nr:hypothetical protein M413DRAFT_393340 [Hebeloma cylindrosporum h7]